MGIKRRWKKQVKEFRVERTTEKERKIREAIYIYIYISGGIVRVFRSY